MSGHLRGRHIATFLVTLLVSGSTGCGDDEPTANPSSTAPVVTTGVPPTSTPAATTSSATATTPTPTTPASTPPTTTTVPPASGRYFEWVFDRVEVVTATFASGLPDLAGRGEVELALDLYQPVGDTQAERPVIVWIHGGSFMGGDRSSLADVATAYARLGYVTVSIDYRLDPENRCQAVQDEQITDPVEMQTERERCRRAIQAAQDDGAAAIAWLRAHATEYRLDPTRIAVGGFSAGAVTAVHLAQHQNVDGPTPPSSAVAVALAASGCNYFPDSIDAEDAPVSMLASGGDQLVPYACSVATLDEAEASGTAVQRLLFPRESGHAMGLYLAHQRQVDTAWRAFLVEQLALA